MLGSETGSHSRVRAGFALPAVLAVTGVVTLIFMVAITALASLTAEATSARSRVRFLQRALNEEAEITYLAATEPITAQGFAVGAVRTLIGSEGPDASEAPSTTGLSAASSMGVVRLDGRSYVSDRDDGLEIALQDQAGMINLNSLNDARMARFTAMLGLPPSVARNLVAIQQDYIDGDDLKQPSGAEKAEYGADIANRPFVRPSEWLNLLGIRSGIDMTKWRAIRRDIASDHTLPTINVNTAPPTTLQVLFGVSAPQAMAAIRARDRAPFYSIQDFNTAAGVVSTDIDDQIYTFPSGRIVYTVRDARSPWVYRARLTLTPAGRERPVWIDQTELTEAARRAVADTSDATRLPYPAR